MAYEAPIVAIELMSDVAPVSMGDWESPIDPDVQ